MSIRKRGDRYQVRVGSGQRLERTLPVGATLADARALEVALGRARIDAAAGRRPRYLIDQALDRWVESHAQSLRSWGKDVRYRVETLRTYTPGRYLDGAPDVADAIRRTALVAQVAPATTNRLLAVLRRVCNLAERWGWTDAPIGRRIALVPGERPHEVYVTPEQVRALADAAEPLTRDMILFAALTGLRRSELLRLTPADIRGDVLIVDSRSKSGRPRASAFPRSAARLRDVARGGRHGRPDYPRRDGPQLAHRDQPVPPERHRKRAPGSRSASAPGVTAGSESRRKAAGEARVSC